MPGPTARAGLRALPSCWWRASRAPDSGCLACPCRHGRAGPHEALLDHWLAPLLGWAFLGQGEGWRFVEPACCIPAPGSPPLGGLEGLLVAERQGPL